MDEEALVKFEHGPGFAKTESDWHREQARICKLEGDLTSYVAHALLSAHYDALSTIRQRAIQ